MWLVRLIKTVTRIKKEKAPHYVRGLKFYTDYIDKCSSVLGITLNILAVINVSVVFSASILRNLALLMDSKVRFQFFCEIFLTATIRSHPGRFASSLFHPKKKEMPSFQNHLFIGHMAMSKILFRPIEMCP